ncbi:MAG TPA: hypothetical protein PLT75_08075 [Spirochaetota bacterium]|nr:hypothetical protein [Spirochaetota bacterium]
MTDFFHTYFLLIAFILYCSSFILFCFSRNALYRVMLIIAVLIHGIFLISSGFFGGIFLLLKVVESPAFLPFAISSIILFLEFRKKDEQPWGYGIILTIIFVLIAILTPRSMTYFGPNKLSWWAIFYFITDFSGQAVFFIGALFSILFLTGRTEKEIHHSIIAYGFVFHTIAQVTGAVWCFLGWAATFQWVFVHLQSAAIWIYYANYLHLRFLPAWNEKRRAVYLTAGAILLTLFKYL